MRSRPVIALSATLALLGSGSALGAVGETQDGPAVGTASSTLTLLDVGLGGRQLSVLELALRSDTLSGSPATAFVVTPLTLDGTPYGRQSLRSRSAALPAVDTRRFAPAALNALAAARSPLVDVTVDGGSSRAGTASLGSVDLLGMALDLTGATSISSVVDGDGARGAKTLTLTKLALPSVADLLAALGLDMTEVPAESLHTLLDRLGLDSVSTSRAYEDLQEVLAPIQAQLAPARDALADAGAQVEAAVEQVEAARGVLAPATTTLNEAAGVLTGGGLLRRGNLVGLDLPVSAPSTVLDVVEERLLATGEELITDTIEPVVEQSTGAVQEALETITAPAVPTVPPTPLTLPTLGDLPTLPAEIPLSLQPAADAFVDAKSAYDGALQTAQDADSTLATAKAPLADAQARVDALLAPHRAQVDAFVQTVVDVLDATPLLSLDRLEVTTRSAVTSATAGGQTAEVVGGDIAGLRVLGTDVLQAAHGSSEVEVLDVAGPVKSKVDAAISGLTGTLSTVLSQVPGLPALEVPAPKIELLSRATSTDVVDGFGVAGSALRAVSVSWPSLSIPAAVALPGAATLPAVAGLPTLPALRRGSLVTAAGDVLSQPLTLSLVTLEDRASFRPARMSLPPGTQGPGAGAPIAGAPTTGAPTAGTPTTGTPTTGTPTSGTPTTGTPTSGTPTTGTPELAAPPLTPTRTDLPRTGASAGPSVLALLLLAAGLALHRRYRTA